MLRGLPRSIITAVSSTTQPQVASLSNITVRRSTTQPQTALGENLNSWLLVANSTTQPQR